MGREGIDKDYREVNKKYCFKGDGGRNGLLKGGMIGRGNGDFTNGIANLV